MVFLYKTKYGLELRCLGENPRFIDTKGISVIRFQYLVTIIGGMFNGWVEHSSQFDQSGYLFLIYRQVEIGWLLLLQSQVIGFLLGF
jgi:hypothetical protein